MRVYRDFVVPIVFVFLHSEKGEREDSVENGVIDQKQKKKVAPTQILLFYE